MAFELPALSYAFDALEPGLEHWFAPDDAGVVLVNWATPG